jgi:hypothetical protein
MGFDHEPEGLSYFDEDSIRQEPPDLYLLRGPTIVSALWQPDHDKQEGFITPFIRGPGSERPLQGSK